MAVPDKIFYLAGLGLLGLGLILHIVGLATPEWSVVPSRYGDGHFEKFDAVRAFAIIGMGFGGFAGFLLFVNLIISFSGRPANKLLAFGSVAASFAALGAVIISVSVWGAYYFGPGINTGYSFILSIVGGILMMIGGLFGFAGFKSGGGHS